MRPTAALRPTVCFWLSMAFSAHLMVGTSVAQTREDAAVVKAEAAATKATAERLAAEKALPAKVAAAKSAAAKAAAANAVADKAVAEKAAAEKLLAEKTAAAKAAVEQVAAAKVEAIRAAARRVAAERIAQRKAALNQVAADIAAKDTAKVKGFTDQAIADKIARDKAVFDKATTDKAAAEKAAAEKDVAVKKANADVAKAVAALAKTPNDKSLAQAVSAARSAAARAERERVNAANALRSLDFTVRDATRQVAAGQDVLQKISAAKKEDFDKNSAAARQVVQAIQNFTTTAVTQTVDLDKFGHEQAVAARTAAERKLVQTIADVRSAATKTATATAAADKAKTARIAAEKVVADRSTAATTATERANTAQEVADQAVAQKAAAIELAGNKTAAEKAALLAEVTAAAKRAADRAAAAKTAAGEAMSRKTAADKALSQTVAAEKKAASGLASAKAAAEQAAAAAKTAREELRRAGPPVKTTLAKYYETLALANGGLKPLPADQWDYAKARHLLCRAGFGGTPDEVEKLHAMGLHAAVEFLVDYENQPAPDLPFDAVIPARPDPSESRLEFTRRRALIVKRRQVDAQQQTRLRDWWLQRMVQSTRPLQEKLVLFWHGHFATEYNTVRDSYAMHLQNDLLREHAAGNFGALLRGIVHDPAMLRYLDNNSNVKGRPNENLAREIMELFSMGEGNYSEEDIMEGARALTGYTYDSNTRQFRFIVSRHDTGSKTIFGKTGNFAGDDFVDLILQQPFTSQFIARKLFVFFAHENPDDESVARLASLLSQNQYDMRPLLKNLFMSEEFYSSETMASQIKSPVQLVVGTLRDLGVRDIAFGTLGSAVTAMGQELFGPPNVKGWEGGQFWVNTNRVLTRYNGVADLVERAVVPNKPRGFDVVAALEGKNLETSEEVVQYLAKSCFVTPLDEAKIKELVNQLGTLPPADQWESQRNQLNAKLRVLLVLMMSMPEYQCT